MERAWIERYESSLKGALKQLELAQDALAARSRLTEAYQALVVLAQVPEHIRGYGHVKARHIDDAQGRWQQASDRFQAALDLEHTNNRDSGGEKQDAQPVLTKVVALHRPTSASV